MTRKLGIAIIAPSGYGRDEAALARATALLEGLGHQVHNYFDPARIFQRFGASDAERLAQLHDAAANPAVDVVMALRGQYGLTRLLAQIDFAALAASGKIFVGFSDFTAFQMALWAKTGRQSYAGPMFYGDFGASDPEAFTLDDFWRCLGGPTHTICQSVCGNPTLDVCGTTWGGNLAMVVSLLGTEYFPRVDDGILFVEDINEHPYRIERMLLQLMQAGVLARQKALVLGDFSSYRLSPADNGYTFETMLAYLRATLPLPVLTGLQFGHGPKRVTIPFGASARLQSDQDGFSLCIGGYPVCA